RHLLGGTDVGVGDLLAVGTGVEEAGQHPPEHRGGAGARAERAAAVVAGDGRVDGESDGRDLALTRTPGHQPGRHRRSGRGREQTMWPAPESSRLSHDPTPCRQWFFRCRFPLGRAPGRGPVSRVRRGVSAVSRPPAGAARRAPAPPLAPAPERLASTFLVCAATGPKRSLIETSTGTAKKIDEYAPTIMPTSCTSARSFSVPTPSSHTAMTSMPMIGRMPMTVVLIERIRVWL